MAKPEPPAEGDRCPHFGSDCCGRLRWRRPQDCSCHINPPCGACTSAPLECDDCGEVLED